MVCALKFLEFGVKYQVCNNFHVFDDVFYIIAWNYADG